MRDFEEYDPEFDTLCPHNHPWNLSHVCRRWRKTALALPRLWSTIYLNFGQYTNLTNRQCVYKGSLLFERSANMDLSMNLGGGEEGIVDHPLTGFLEASAPRWRTLNVHLPSWSLQSFSGWEFPMLRELGIGYQGGTDSTDYYIDIFRNVANVRTVSFYHTAGPDESYIIVGPFPWSIVTKLSCYSFTAEHQFMSILERSAGLEELTMKIGMVYVNVAMDLVVSLPMLQRIDITEYLDGSPGTLAEFLHHLRVPSIRHLALTFPAHFICFQPYLRSHPDLRRVTSLQIECSMGLIPEGEDYAGWDYIGGTKTLLKFLAL
ncbi:hypothetical protein BDZ89DRAFT_999660 [Hymenopellis radicata]|nr:hypothetical protein BDZ89DRAFT_999660 [Hymenopellis radicata]